MIRTIFTRTDFNQEEYLFVSTSFLRSPLIA